jgi:hypothetical protein
MFLKCENAYNCNGEGHYIMKYIIKDIKCALNTAIRPREGHPFSQLAKYQE